MDLTKRELLQVRKIFRSMYGWLQVKKDSGVYSVDEKTAQCLVEKGLAEYTGIGTTKFVRLTAIGSRCHVENEGKNESV